MQFTQQLAAASLVSDEEHDPELYTRDKEDDYLMYAALVQKVDYLVTGDEDLLVLGQVKDVQILTPVTFYKVLKKARLL